MQNDFAWFGVLLFVAFVLPMLGLVADECGKDRAFIECVKLHSPAECGKDRAFIECVKLHSPAECRE